MISIKELIDEIKKADKEGLTYKCVKLCRSGIDLVKPDQINDWYGLRITLLKFLLLLKEDRAKNIEESISLVNEMLQTIKKGKNPIKWASLQRNLGYLYDQRIEGEKQSNLAKSIGHYKNTLEILTKEAYPEDWAMINAGIALAYSEKIGGNFKNNVQNAIKYFENTLLIYNKEEYPEDYEDSVKELYRLKEKLR